MFYANHTESSQSPVFHISIMLMDSVPYLKFAVADLVGPARAWGQILDLSLADPYSTGPWLEFGRRFEHFQIQFGF